MIFVGQDGAVSKLVGGCAAALASAVLLTASPSLAPPQVTPWTNVPSLKNKFLTLNIRSLSMTGTKSFLVVAAVGTPS